MHSPGGVTFYFTYSSCYAIVELEMLATVWAVRKCDVYLHGVNVIIIISDHKLIIPIINGKQLDEIQNPRLHRLKQKLMMSSYRQYSFERPLDHFCDSTRRISGNAQGVNNSQKVCTVNTMADGATRL